MKTEELLKYRITYVKSGKTFGETIYATDCSQAKDICKSKGDFVACISVKAEKLINVTLVGLIGKDVKGLRAQVRNPIYLSSEMHPQWRTLTVLKTFKEKGKQWVELEWKKESDDSCNFTGCTVESDMCTIQFEESEFAKLKPLKK